jgi:hypothetical protein
MIGSGNYGLVDEVLFIIQKIFFFENVDLVTVKLKIVLHVFAPEVLGYSLPDRPQRAVEAPFFDRSCLWFPDVLCLSGVMLEHVFFRHGFYCRETCL